MIIIRPILSEKSAGSLSAGGYVFEVSSNATKQSVAGELKKLFKVKAISVRLVNLPAKKVSFKRVAGVRAARRRAYVQLAPKQHLPGFELPKEKEKKDAKS